MSIGLAIVHELLAMCLYHHLNSYLLCWFFLQVLPKGLDSGIVCVTGLAVVNALRQI